MAETTSSAPNRQSMDDYIDGLEAGMHEIRVNDDETRIIEKFDDGEHYEYRDYDEYFSENDSDEYLAERGLEAKSPLLVELEKAGRERHQAYANLIQGPVYDREERQRLLDAHDDKQEAFLEAQSDYLREQFNVLIDARSSDSDEDAAIQAVLDDVNNLIAEHKEMEKFEEKQSVLKSGGKMAKVLNWYGNLSGSKKIIATAGLGAGAGVAAFFMPIAAGAAGVAVAAGGVMRYGRGYMARKAQLYKDYPDQVDLAVTAEMLADEDFEIHETIKDYFANLSNERIERAEVIKRGAVRSGLGAVAIGGAIGTVANIAVETGAVEAVGGQLSRLQDWLFSDDKLADTPRSMQQIVDIFRQGVEKLQDMKQELLGADIGSDGVTESADTESESSTETGSSETNKPEIGETGELAEESGTDEEIPGDEDLASEDAPSSSEAPEIVSQLSEVFTIEAGHGYTHEIMDAAQLTGVDISAEEAWKIHMGLVDKFGPDYITIADAGVNDTYSMGSSKYEVGLSSAGQATWNPEAAQYLADIFDNGQLDDSINTSGVGEVAPEATNNQPEVPNELVDKAKVNLDAGVELGLSEIPSSPDTSSLYQTLEQTPTSTPQVDVDNLHQTLEQTPIDNTPRPDASSLYQTLEQAPVEEVSQVEVPDEAVAAGIDNMVERMENDTDKVIGGWDTLYGDIQSLNILFGEGEIAAINNDPTYQILLSYLDKAIGGMTYVGSETSILEWQPAQQQWVVNNPDGKIPEKLFEALRAYELTALGYGS